MNYFTRKHYEPQTKKWWKHLLLGILFLLLGTWIFITPMTSYMSLSLFFTLALIITGVFEIVGSTLYRKETNNWGWHLVGGIIDFIIGGVLLFNPVMTMSMLPYVLAIWLMYKGVVSTLIALRLKSFDIKGWVWMLAMGIGTLLFAILIYIYPVLGGLSIVYATAMGFLALGMFNFSVAYHLGKLRKHIENSL
ncbi:DUF308 domain-containing protein [uncultured Kriegella sp.]|uniref:HdeD family acid-resistance protein n=1 Tax=uncultured Kriegella sp. TaxID=1798910 RepID=UPI0030D9B4C9|tara:strand:- start:37081 stop:37659 length:579 start_codon:yes stop_codon:yes gene_type:complete